MKDIKAKSSVPKGNYIFNIRGNSDTEHLATLFFAHLDLVNAGIAFANSSVHFGVDSTNAMLLALILTIGDIHEIQSVHQVGPFTPVDTPHANRVGNSLNLCISAI